MDDQAAPSRNARRRPRQHFRRRIEVRVRETDLLSRNLALSDFVTAVQSATAIRGGGFVDTAEQRVLVEPKGAAITAADIAASVVAPDAAGPISVGDVADVVDAATPRFGDAMVMGEPGVLLTLSSQYGANTLTTTTAVEAALAELGPSLKAQDVTIFPALHRPANFIETALSGVRGDLLLGRSSSPS
jgi:Cu/Ag efflux pump CusA